MAKVQQTSLRQSDRGSEGARVQECEPPREYGNGWHSIEVFYGKTEHFEQINPVKEWGSQANQDLVVSRLFGGKTNGYFLDLASNHAVLLSNTYSLEKRFNWTGLCMEPNEKYWSGLAHRDCQVVAAVVGKIRMDEVVFQGNGDKDGMVGSVFGGIVGEDFDNHNDEGAEVKYTVPLSEILSRFNAPKEIDYLSLDVEGAEYLIMQHFPFLLYNINVMTVERPQENLKALFTEYGYELLGIISTFGETLWVRKAIKNSLNIASVKEFFIQ